MVNLRKKIAAAITAFLELDDTPASYSGQAGKYCKVNAGEDALEFAVGTAGIVEGDYTSWTLKWVNDISLHPDWEARISFFIDDKNDVIYVAWVDPSVWYRFEVYNVSDFSRISADTSGTDYTSYRPDSGYRTAFALGGVSLSYGGLSRSLQTYALILLNDEKTIEVWRGGSSGLWSRNVDLDTPQDYECVIIGAISLTGKYILVSVADFTNSPYTYKLVLYEGS